METLTTDRTPAFGGAWRGLTWLAGAVATLAAAAIGAVLFVITAASLVVIVLMASVVMVFAGFALRAQRRARTNDPTVIDAHNVGGHSWVAYGWRDGAH